MIDCRILYLVPDLYGSPGGIARHGRIVSQALLQAGAELTVLALHDRPSTPSPPPLRAMAYRPCGGRREAFAVRAVRAASARPDLILVEHVHFAPLGLLVGRLAGAPVVVFAHGTEIWDRLATVRRWALRRADCVICASRTTEDRAVHSNGLNRQKTCVLHHCLDPELTFRTPRTPDPSSLSLLTVGRISAAEQYKGHDAVIRALPALLQRFPQLMYDVVGDGNGRPALERLAAREGVAHAVRFHGFVSEEHLARFYAGASLFVMPSRGEGFGFAFLEAMVHRKPVIAGIHDAAVEVVRHGETGLLVNPTDSSELTSALVRLLGDSSLRLHMGRHGAEVVAREFSFDTFRDRLYGHLLDVLGRERRSGNRVEARNPTGS